jgi:hypothetical protein
VTRFIDRVYTQLGTTSNYSATAISTIHRSPQHTLSLFQAAVSSPDILWQRLLTVEILQFHALRSALHSLPCRTELSTESESYVTTDGQPASLSWNKAPFWGLRPDLYYCLKVAGLLILGALSNERTGLLFTIAAGSRQRSHFRVRIPYDSWPYFTVSYLRLPFSSPPTTRRVTVEVFDPASTRVSLTELPTDFVPCL